MSKSVLFETAGEVRSDRHQFSSKEEKSRQDDRLSEINLMSYRPEYPQPLIEYTCLRPYARQAHPYKTHMKKSCRIIPQTASSNLVLSIIPPAQT
jgi:hypothetical protein